jgi:hypothetical protein
MQVEIINNKKYIDGVYYPTFLVGDRVRLRTEDEVYEINGPALPQFDTHRSWLTSIRTKNIHIRPGETQTVTKVERSAYGPFQNVLFGNPPRAIVATWALIKVEEKPKQVYRKTEDGFMTCDDNWLPENRWF